MIRWITESLGTCNGDYAVVSDEVIIDVRDMVDKGGNDPKLIREKLDFALLSLQAEKKVVVRCDYGMSRSNSIAAGILALHKNMHLSDAIKDVVKATNEKAIKIEVLDAVRKAIQFEKTAVLEPRNERPRVIITGGTGFLASKLIPKLLDFADVLAPSHKDIDIAVDTVLFDLLVKEHRADLIVHLAAPRVYTTNFSMGDTVTMLKNVLDVCKQNNTPLIYLSSWEVFTGYKSPQLLAPENLLPNPATTYGGTKMLCERLIEMYRQQFNVKVTVVRSGPIYGKGSDKPKLIFDFARKASMNLDITTHLYKNGPSRLDLLHINDFVAGLTALIRYVSSNRQQLLELIHFGSGALTSIPDIAKLAVKTFKSTSKIQHVEIDDYVCNVQFDYSNAERLFAWNPIVSPELGLTAVIMEITSAITNKEN